MTIFNILIGLLWTLLPFETGGAPAAGDASGGTPPEPKPGDAPASGTPAADSGSKADPPAGSDDSGEPTADNAAQRASREAAGYRTKLREEQAKNTALMAALRPALETLGIKVEGGGTPDPAELTKQVDSWRSKYMAERVANAIHRQAATAGARPDALTRYLRGGSELSELDPEADNFEQELQSVVQRALTDEPSLKVAAAPPPRSGAEFNGAGTGKTIDEQIAEAEKSGDYRTSIRLKEARQAQLGSGGGGAAH
jgi:hypothetical protein